MMFSCFLLPDPQPEGVSAMTEPLCFLSAAVLLIIAAISDAAFYTETDPELDRSSRRCLYFVSSTCRFIAVLLLSEWLRTTGLVQETSGIILSAFVLWLLLTFAAFWIQKAASVHEWIWAERAGKLTVRLTSWIIGWIPVPEKLYREPERAEKMDSEEEEIDAIDVAENALDLNDKTLDEICTHRSEIVSLDVNDSPEEWRRIILNNRHTFYPVYNENEEDIIGVLDTRDYFRMPEGHSQKSILDHTTDQPFFVAENTTADELLHQMKKKKNYFAVVLDEYGGMTGIVTLHDILEELLGDITEAEDAIRPADIVKLPRGMWRISGSADLEEVSEALGEKLELDDYETFSGFILGTLGYIPEDGTQLETRIGSLMIQITSIKNHRIRQTLVKKAVDTEKAQ